MKGKCPSQRTHSLETVDGGKDKSGHGKKTTECEALAIWEAAVGETGQDRDRKCSIYGHPLPAARREGTIQDTEACDRAKGHSLPVDHRGMHKSGP